MNLHFPDTDSDVGTNLLRGVHWPKNRILKAWCRVRAGLGDLWDFGVRMGTRQGGV